MTTKTNEEFFINDLDLKISPSDVQVMDDNWVMEDTYLRSKAVYCFRSKYAATKVVLNIPFQVTNMHQESEDVVNNTMSCIKLITQLSSYPFCFIRNQRIRSYIAPTHISFSGFMMFAVDEISLVQDAQASNIVFLEVVLQYFNHAPLVQDFSFKDKALPNTNQRDGQLSKNIREKEGKDIKDPSPTVSRKEAASNSVSTLKDSQSFAKFMGPRFNAVIDNLSSSGIFQLLNSPKDTHYAMGVKIQTPLMYTTYQDMIGPDDGRLLDGDSFKIVNVTDTSKYDNGTYENMLATLLDQDFTMGEVAINERQFEDVTLQKNVKTENRKDKSKERAKQERIRNEHLNEGSTLSELNSEAESLEEKNGMTGSKQVYIQWQSVDIDNLRMAMSRIKVTKKNKLATHQISSYKHPVVQYLGSYPTTIQLNMASGNFGEVYENSEDYPTTVILKQILNVLDYNRQSLPEAEAYNFLKIKCLSTFLLDAVQYVPSQSVISASANQQGVEHLVYSFHESDLASFIDQSKVTPSGKLSIEKVDRDLLFIVRTWLLTYLKVDHSNLFKTGEAIPETLSAARKQQQEDLIAKGHQGMSGVYVLPPTIKALENDSLHLLETAKATVELALAGLSNFGYTETIYNQVLKDALVNFSHLSTEGFSKALDLYTIKSDVRVPKYFWVDSLFTNKLNEEELAEVFIEPTEQANKLQGKYAGASSKIRKEKEDEKRREIAGEGRKVKILTESYFRNVLLLCDKILQIKQNLVANNSPGESLENLVYSGESAQFNRALLKVASSIQSGLEETTSDSFKGMQGLSEKFQDSLDSANSQHIKSFYGYNYKDLDLERLITDSYDEKEDINVQDLSPFFFIDEVPILNGTELEETYSSILESLNPAASIVEGADKDKEQYIENVETGTTHMGVGYTKLNEVEYDKDKERANQSRSSGSSFSSVSDPAREVELQLTIYEFLVNQRGLTPKQAMAITAEIGRENDYNENTIFGSHYDIAKNSGKRILNVGLLSWNQGREEGLLNKLKSKGWWDESTKTMPKTDEVLYLQLDYLLTETKTSHATAMKDFYLNPNADVYRLWDSTHKFIGWARGQTTVRGGATFDSKTHEGRLISHYEKLKKRVEAGETVSKLKNGQEALDLEPGWFQSTLNAVFGSEVTAPQDSAVANPKIKTTTPEESQKNVKKVSDSVTLQTIEKNRINQSNGVKTSGKTIQAILLKTIDGDTIKVRDVGTLKEYNIRVAGINTPETYKEFVEGSREEILAGRAKKEFDNLISKERSNLTIELGQVDTNGRTVGTIRLKDGTNPALTLVQMGLAYADSEHTTDGSYKKAEDDAKRNKRGFWSLPDELRVKPATKNQVISNEATERFESEMADASKKNPPTLMFTNTQAKALNKDATRHNESGAVNSWRPMLDQNTKITSPYYRRYDGRTNHWGVDFGCPTGTDIIAAASGKVIFSGVQNGYGKVVKLDHLNGFTSLYAHLDKQLVKVGDTVKAEQIIAKSGNTGRSSGPHLHYEVRYNNVAVNPFKIHRLTSYTGEGGYNGHATSVGVAGAANMQAYMFTPDFDLRAHVNDSNTVFNENELAAAIFRNIYKNVNMGLQTSLPAIKVYLTIGNENDKLWMDSMLLGIEYYELRGIKSFRMNCNNDNNPIDTVIMEVADPSFLQTDAFMGLSRLGGIRPDSIGTDYATQFKNGMLQLKSGSKLHIRAGYGNDPNKLPIIFNGTIVDTNTTAPQSIMLVCESYGKELLSDILGAGKPTWVNEQSDHCSTSSLIGHTLQADSVSHFGYSAGFWSNLIKGHQDPEDRKLGPSAISQSRSWFFNITDRPMRPQKLYMNVFAPEIEAVHQGIFEDKGILGYLMRDFIKATSGLYTQGYPFALYRTTPWAAMKQAEYRHPGTVLKPMWFEDRCTLFYGIKEQMYFARDINNALQEQVTKEKNESDNFGKDMSPNAISYFKQRRERMEPVSNFHLVTSGNNLISNGLRLNSEYATRIKVNYYDDQDLDVAASLWKQESLEMNMDDNIFPWEIRTKELALSGCLSKYAAIVYGTTALKKEAEKMYGGKITILGNPDLKAGDYVFLDDTEKRMSGLVLVREVSHVFDANNGFITEFVPGQYVEAANFMYSDLWFKLMCCSKIATSKMKTYIANNYSTEDFNITLDYLTIMNQLQIAAETFKQYNETFGVFSYAWDNKDQLAYHAAPITLVLLGLKSLASLNGMKGVLGNTNGIRFGGGITRFSVAAYRNVFNKAYSGLLFDGKVDKKLDDLMRASSKWFQTQLYSGKGAAGKLIAGGFNYFDKGQEAFEKIKAYQNKKNGLMWRSTKVIGVGTARASFFAMKTAGNALRVGLKALYVAGPIGVLLDVVATYVMTIVFDRIDEVSYTRQPLMLFPIVRHGRAYTAGMSGLHRNTWWESKKEELSKTIKEVRKAANIIYTSRSVTGKSPDSWISSLLDSVRDPEDFRNRGPVLITNYEGYEKVINRSSMSDSPVIADKVEDDTVKNPFETYKEEEAFRKMTEISKESADSFKQDKIELNNALRNQQ